MREPVFNETVQLGIVVRDLEATVRRYVDDYGIGPWEFHQIDAGEANNYREYGRPVERSTLIAVATVGRVMWELIEPLDEEGIYARFLAEKGEGIHPSAGNRGFSEVWPGGAQRSSRSTCRTDRAELYPHDLPFCGCPSTPPSVILSSSREPDKRRNRCRPKHEPAARTVPRPMRSVRPGPTERRPNQREGNRDHEADNHHERLYRRRDAGTRRAGRGAQGRIRARRMGHPAVRQRGRDVPQPSLPARRRVP